MSLARLPLLLAALTIAAAAPRAEAPAPARNTLERLRTGHGPLRLGYRTDARPFAYKDETGRAAGYSVAICQSVVAAMRHEAGLQAATADFVPVKAADRFAALEDGRIDILCGATTVSLARRAHMSFSTPIFAGGIGAVMRNDAAPGLREVLAGRVQTSHPAWQAGAADALHASRFGAVEGTTADTWLRSEITHLGVVADVSTASGYEVGVQDVLDRKTDVFFGERAIVLDAAGRNPLRADLAIVERMFTFEPLALALPRGDEELRLVVDRTLNRLYASDGIATLYAKYFGPPDPTTLTFFKWNTMPN
jgi:ABC-type amino acid transport substrate-binding protein